MSAALKLYARRMLKCTLKLPTIYFISRETKWRQLFDGSQKLIPNGSKKVFLERFDKFRKVSRSEVFVRLLVDSVTQTSQLIKILF